MVEPQSSKLITRVRFPSSAPARHDGGSEILGAAVVVLPRRRPGDQQAPPTTDVPRPPRDGKECRPRGVGSTCPLPRQRTTTGMRQHCSAVRGPIASGQTPGLRRAPRRHGSGRRLRATAQDEEGDHDHASRRLLPRGEHPRARPVLLSVSPLSLERPLPHGRRSLRRQAPVARLPGAAPCHPCTAPADPPSVPALRRRPPTMKRKSWHASTTTSRSSSATRPSSA